MSIEQEHNVRNNHQRGYAPKIAKRSITSTMLPLAIACLFGCDESSRSNTVAVKSGPSFHVMSVSHPLADLTQQILDGVAEVDCPLPDNAEPDSWRPAPEQIAKLQASDLIITNGSAAPYAKWLTHVTLPESKICQTANDGLAVADMIMIKDVRIVHSHGPEGEHSHPTMVAYTWLDPAIAKQQAAHITQRLKQTYPQHVESISANGLQLAEDLDRLIEQVASLKGLTDQQHVLTTTPELKFFTRSLGMQDQHLAWFEHPDSATAKAKLTEIMKKAQPKPKYLLWAAEPTAELHEVASSVGLTNIEINKLDHFSNNQNYLTAAGNNYSTLQEAFEATPAVKTAP